jgi:hypothetical protein
MQITEQEYDTILELKIAELTKYQETLISMKEEIDALLDKGTLA